MEILKKITKTKTFMVKPQISILSLSNSKMIKIKILYHLDRVLQCSRIFILNLKINQKWTLQVS